MNEITKELFDGFMTTFNRKNDVMVGVDHEMQSAQRNFKIIKDVAPDDRGIYSPLESGKQMGKLLNEHELISDRCTSKIVLNVKDDREHCTNLGDGYVRYKLFVELLPI